MFSAGSTPLLATPTRYSSPLVQCQAASNPAEPIRPLSGTVHEGAREVPWQGRLDTGTGTEERATGGRPTRSSSTKQRSPDQGVVGAVALGPCNVPRQRVEPSERGGGGRPRTAVWMEVKRRPRAVGWTRATQDHGQRLGDGTGHSEGVSGYRVPIPDTESPVPAPPSRRRLGDEHGQCRVSTCEDSLLDRPSAFGVTLRAGARARCPAAGLAPVPGSTVRGSSSPPRSGRHARRSA